MQRYGELVARSQPMLQLFGQLRRLENSSITLLIEGESGTGKELIARVVHERSARAQGPFVAINCAAVEPGLIRTELFGHRRGAFTGACETHHGAFEAACGGTLFLDEIGELGAEAQAVLLRALETRTICRVGETVPRRVDVRLVAATNRDLAVEVQTNRFRTDLFFRLAVARVRVPALRERREDIELLAQELASEMDLAALPGSVVRTLAARSWPGNVRELRNALQVFTVFGDLPPPLLDRTPAEECAGPHDFIDLARPYAEQKAKVLEWFQAVYFRRLLSVTQGNRSQAARISGLERSYLNKVVKSIQEEDGSSGTDTRNGLP